jgi:Spy/CpxP family protein refolding chaperone
MKRYLATAIIFGLFSFPALAQDQDAPKDDPVPRERMPRGERGERGERGPRGERGMRMAERLVEQLELDDTQRAHFDDIMAAHRERMQAFGSKRQAIREAMEAGDQATADKLRAEMEGGGGWQGSLEQALDELEPVLREDQIAKLDEIRAEQRRRDGGREEMQRITRELPDELKLDDAQKEQFEELLQNRREEMRERMGEMRPLFEEMRAAQEAGDTAKLEELRQQMESKRPNREMLLTEFFTQVDTILRDDQKPLLAAYREQLDADVASGRGAQPASIRSLFRAASRLELSDEQRDELKTIQREATTELREVGRRDKEGQALVVASVKERIVRLLDATQAAEFEEALSKTSRRGR